MSEQLNYSKSRWNGWNGNECVYRKDYQKAIEYYNTAIELYPLEYRYFVNRSFCFDQLQRFELALEDAERALHLQSDWGKCYYRKARALKGLKRLEEADNCFLKVIQLEGYDCREAQQELKSLRQSMANTTKDTENIEFNSNSFPDIRETIDTKTDRKSAEEKNIKTREVRKHSSKESLPLNPNTNDMNRLLTTQSTVGSLFEENIAILSQCFKEKNILKELSDLLLNKNVLSSKWSDKCFELKISEKKYESEQKLVINDKKIPKSTYNPSKPFIESKIKINRRNDRKSMDKIVEVWDDSRNHWSSSLNRPQNYSKSYRKAEPTNPWQFRGLYVSNIIPTEETKQILWNIMSEFGKVTLVVLIPENESASINFDNPESPRFAMSRLQGKHLPNVCFQNQNLRIKFRPLNDSKNYPSLNSSTERVLNNECYFWRTTGCSYTKYNSCKLKHIPANKGVDFQPWMQSIKGRYKGQHRNRFDK